MVFVLQNTPFWYTTCLWVVLVTFFWNGCFFMERVVANYAVRSTQAKDARKQQGSPRAAAGTPRLSPSGLTAKSNAKGKDQ